MSDLPYRERVRVWLHEQTGDEWCDYLAETCVCNKAWQPDWEKDGKTYTGITKIFPGAEPVEIEP